jgi:hypothetical protein
MGAPFVTKPIARDNRIHCVPGVAPRPPSGGLPVHRPRWLVPTLPPGPPLYILFAGERHPSSWGMVNTAAVSAAQAISRAARAGSAVAVNFRASLTGNHKAGICDFCPSPLESGARMFALLYATVIPNVARGYANSWYRPGRRQVAAAIFKVECFPKET